MKLEILINDFNIAYYNQRTDPQNLYYNFKLYIAQDNINKYTQNDYIKR